MISNPRSQFFFPEFSCRHSIESQILLLLACHNIPAVFEQENTCQHIANPLIAIYEWMIFNDTKSIGCCECRKIRRWFPIAP